MGAILASLTLRIPRPLESPETLYNTPLPKIIHKTLRDIDIAGRQVLVVGDVHGCFAELKELIERSGVNPQHDVILFCGDIINKGPESIETLNYIRSLGNTHVVRGNHEEAILREYASYFKSPQNDLKKKYHWIQNLTQGDFNYLSNLPYTISIPSLSVIVVHGGLFPWKPLDQQQPKHLTQMRNICDGDGPAPKVSKSTDEGLPWASFWNGPQHVYFGHDAVRKLQLHKFATGLDTACVYGGHLTGKLLTGTKEFVVVKAKMTYRDPYKMSS